MHLRATDCPAAGEQDHELCPSVFDFAQEADLMIRQVDVHTITDIAGNNSLALFALHHRMHAEDSDGHVRLGGFKADPIHRIEIRMRGLAAHFIFHSAGWVNPPHASCPIWSIFY